VIFGWLFYGYGLGLFGKLGVTAALGFKPLGRAIPAGLAALAVVFYHYVSGAERYWLADGLRTFPTLRHVTNYGWLGVEIQQVTPEIAKRAAAANSQRPKPRPVSQETTAPKTAPPAPTGAMTLPTQLMKLRNAPSGCAPVCP